MKRSASENIWLVIKYVLIGLMIQYLPSCMAVFGII